MTLQPTVDHGQKNHLAGGQGNRVFWIAKPSAMPFADAVRAAGSSSKISTLHGEDGIHLLERLKENSFFFGDSEDDIIQFSIRELEQGHYAVAVEVLNHDQAANIARLAQPHGGRHFSYFGTWVTEAMS